MNKTSAISKLCTYVEFQMPIIGVGLDVAPEWEKLGLIDMPPLFALYQHNETY